MPDVAESLIAKYHLRLRACEILFPISNIADSHPCGCADRKLFPITSSLREMSQTHGDSTSYFELQTSQNSMPLKRSSIDHGSFEVRE